MRCTDTIVCADIHRCPYERARGGRLVREHTVREDVVCEEYRERGVGGNDPEPI